MEARLGKSVNLNIVEVRSPDLNAQLVAENIAQQLEKRISFRRAMKKAMQQATRLGAKGHQGHLRRPSGRRRNRPQRVLSRGHHPPADSARRHRVRLAEAATTYGRIGVKVWIYKGEVLNTTLRADRSRGSRAVRRRDNRRGDRRGSPGGERPGTGDGGPWGDRRRDDRREGGNR